MADALSTLTRRVALRSGRHRRVLFGQLPAPAIIRTPGLLMPIKQPMLAQNVVSPNEFYPVDDIIEPRHFYYINHTVFQFGSSWYETWPTVGSAVDG